MFPQSVLIIDDEEKLRNLLGRIISLERFAVEEAGTLKAGLQVLQHKSIGVVVCDVKLPDGNGVDFVKEIKTKFPQLEVILLTAYGNIADGVQAIKNGAFDYIVKGDDNDRIIPLLNQAMDKAVANKKTAIQVKNGGSYSFADIIGTSTSIREVVKLASKIAPTDANVLLLGETGTGKEVFANAIHASSKRAAHALVAINCSAFAKDLLEGELFGHKAGAYTGALKDKKGLIEMADGGTLFLDEIGEMNIELQAKLLRVIENGEFIKLGDTKTTHVNIRVIAATNRNLELEVEKGHFREDLYYRINVFTITLPALRQRLEDIPALVNHFLNKYAKKAGTAPVHISKGALQLLQSHNWKGNIRELKNTLERAIILTDTQEIETSDFPFDIQTQGGQPANNLSLAAVEKSHIYKVLQVTHGNKTKAAELLGIGLTTLYRKMEEYKLEN
jgi:two-component system NtrC family response regulator